MSTIKELEKKARIIRLGILEAIGEGQKSHIGGSMSSEIWSLLYFHKMRHTHENPKDPKRDRLIFSKGHAVLAQYAALAECSYFPKEELKNQDIRLFIARSP